MSSDVDDVRKRVWMGLGGLAVLATLAGFLVQYLTS